MKKILFVLSLVVSCNLMASGKISVQPSYFIQTGKAGAQAGIAIYEHIAGGVAYSGWTGLGLQPRAGEGSVLWVTSKHSLEKNFGDLGVGLGFSIRHAEQEILGLYNDQEVFVKLSWKLW